MLFFLFALIRKLSKAELLLKYIFHFAGLSGKTAAKEKGRINRPLRV